MGWSVGHEGRLNRICLPPVPTDGSCSGPCKRSSPFSRLELGRDRLAQRRQCRKTTADTSSRRALIASMAAKKKKFLMLSGVIRNRGSAGTPGNDHVATRPFSGPGPSAGRRWSAERLDAGKMENVGDEGHDDAPKGLEKTGCSNVPSGKVFRKGRWGWGEYLRLRPDSLVSRSIDFYRSLESGHKQFEEWNR